MGRGLRPARQLGAIHRIEATTLFGVVALGAFVIRRGDFDLRVFAWITLPVALLSFALIPLLGQTAGALVSFLVKFTYVSFALFALALIANVAYRFEVPSTRLFAYARASSEGAMLAGIVLRRALSNAGLLDSQTTLWLITLVGLIAIVGCVLLWHSERSVTSGWGALGIDVSSGAHVAGERERLMARCDELAREHALTPREAEIVGLLARRLEAPQIEQALFLSHNTLKTHLRHIYAKLGVHTREELLALVGAAESRPR